MQWAGGPGQEGSGARVTQPVRAPATSARGPLACAWPLASLGLLSHDGVGSGSPHHHQGGKSGTACLPEGDREAPLALLQVPITRRPPGTAPPSLSASQRLAPFHPLPACPLRTRCLLTDRFQNPYMKSMFTAWRSRCKKLGNAPGAHLKLFPAPFSGAWSPCLSSWRSGLEVGLGLLVRSGGPRKVEPHSPTQLL